MTTILAMFKLRDSSVPLHCCLGRRLDAELRNAPSPPSLAHLLLSPRHSLSHEGSLLAEWWVGTCGTGEMVEEHRGAPDVCMTTSGTARMQAAGWGCSWNKAKGSFSPASDDHLIWRGVWD